MVLIPVDERVDALRARKLQIERRLQRCHAAAEQAKGRNPSAGRELDDAQATLATVRAELAKLLGAR